MSAYSTLYDFCRDQGSLVGGILALLAGVLLYCVGRQQVHAITAQSRELKNEKRRDLARGCLIAGRLLDGVLDVVAEEITGIGNLGDDANPLGEAATNDIRQKLNILPLYPILGYLGQFNPEAIDGYYLLRRKIEKFRERSTGTSPRELMEKLQSIRVIQEHCREEIARDTANAHQVLHDTQRQT